MKYCKLVRDKILERIKNNGKDPEAHVASEEEYWKKLKEKLLEEVSEFLEDSNEEELSDVLEVIDSIKKHKNFDEKKILEIKRKKFEEKGGFEKRIILDEVKEKLHSK